MNEDNKKLKENILDRLEREGITPHSRFYWLTYEYSLWGAWGVSVALGAVALAVLSFSSIYIGFSLFEATHDGFWVYVIEALPYLWLIAFLALILVAYFNLKHTKRGYRYPLPMVVGSSFGFSILGAMLLHFMGVGFYLDSYLGENLSGYQSRAEFEAQMWQNPKSGRLLGVAVLPAEEGKPIAFIDSNKEEWSLHYRELRPRDSELLLSGERVRVLVATSTNGQIRGSLVACAVFPWMLDTPPPFNRLKEDRRQFMEEMQEKRKEFREVMEEIKEVVTEDKRESIKQPASTTNTGNLAANFTNSPCANHPLFKSER